ncbi:hypothetical protein B0H16DRAFT_1461374 [Mycena metata]|uniref:Uncharacterized protein n=1 Tax=Mycena metata TaxID=1033252 RepID=A0AAD7N8E6_9AGAR|nr:hypothetical protein B0H16DRAFT_1461374 [Mycena metata]
MHPAALSVSHPLLEGRPQNGARRRQSGVAPPPPPLSIPAQRNKKGKKTLQERKEGRKERKPASSGPRPRTKGESVKGRERKGRRMKDPAHHETKNVEGRTPARTKAAVSQKGKEGSTNEEK